MDDYRKTNQGPDPHEPRELSELAARVAQEDDQAADELLARLASGLRCFFRSRGVSNAEQVENLVQETSVQLWLMLYLRKFDPSTGFFLPYVRGVAKRILSNRIRSRTRDQRRQQGAVSWPETADTRSGLLDLESPGPNPEELAEYGRLVNALQQCIGHKTGASALDDEEREVIEGHCRGDRRSTIAKRARFAKYKVTRLFKKACRKLARCLKAKGFTGDHLSVVESVTGNGPGFRC